MPQGFGYGSIGKAFDAIRGGLHRAGGAVNRYGAKDALFGSGARGYLGMGAVAVGDALRFGGGLSNAGLLGAAGGLAGGTYGAFSDDTSVLGGMLGGAALGAGGYGMARLGTAGAKGYMAARAGGAGAGQAARAGFSQMASMSSAYIGNTMTRAGNAFSALGARARSGVSALNQRFRG